jgi:hypothetical protein
MNNARLLLCALVCFTGTAGLAVADLRVGVGSVVITPEEPIWLSGYASRSAPSDGKVQDIFAKAIVFEDENGERSVVVTTDLIGLTRNLSARTAALVLDEFGISRERLMLTASHTHCAPAIRENLASMYALDEEQTRRVNEYSEALPGKIVEAVRMAVNDLEPGSAHWGHGEAGFAINRRQYTQSGVALGVNPIGPVDHDVPIVVAKRNDGSVKGVLFAYACHNTTLDFQQISGDYAGFAQAHIEDALPGTVALFASGCGADANPHPRRSLELAKQHGAELGAAVLDAMQSELTELDGPVRAVYDEVTLELSEPPTREELEAQLQSENVYIQRRAKNLLQQLETNGALKTTYPYPIQIFQFGDALQITALGGEVVVDYALRIKHEFGQDNQFIIGYANDVMAYIPSLRVLREGGYEARLLHDLLRTLRPLGNHRRRHRHGSGASDIGEVRADREGQAPPWPGPPLTTKAIRPTRLDAASHRQPQRVCDAPDSP